MQPTDIIDINFYESCEIIDSLRYISEDGIKYYEYLTIKPDIIARIKELILFSIMHIKPENQQIDFENMDNDQIIMPLEEWKSEVTKVLEDL